MPQEKPKKKGSPRAQMSALLGIPQAGAVPWDRPYLMHNPENIRPRPDNPRSGRGDVRVFAQYGPGFEPATERYPGHMGLEFALLNGFRSDTLSGLFGEPEGGVEVYPNMGLNQVLTREQSDGTIMAEPFSYKRGRGQPDRIVIQQGKMNEKKFAEGLTHEYVHRAHNRGLPGSERGHVAALDLTERLRNMSRMFGEESMANAIARALSAVRTIPEESREFHSGVAGVSRAGDPEEYRVSPAAADSATAWIYALLGRE